MVAGVRLAKYLATAGVASRRKAEELIRAGRVTVAGEPITDPACDVTDASRVAVDGRTVTSLSERVVYALNKPAGVVSTARDPQRRPTVVALIPSTLRLYPVGRLDLDSSGLILLTNDGELAHRLTHPSFEVEKTYRVTVARGPIRSAAIEALRRGVELEDGRTSPARVRRVLADTLEITIHEGRNRQVKRMCEAVGHRVKQLERIRFGSLSLDGLSPGAHRRLSEAEVRALLAASERPPAHAGHAGSRG
jgi:23S rRNA pseudouridine2605 synthase